MKIVKDLGDSFLLNATKEDIVLLSQLSSIYRLQFKDLKEGDEIDIKEIHSNVEDLKKNLLDFIKEEEKNGININ